MLISTLLFFLWARSVPVSTTPTPNFLQQLHNAMPPNFNAGNQMKFNQNTVINNQPLNHVPPVSSTDTGTSTTMNRDESKDVKKSKIPKMTPTKPGELDEEYIEL